MKYDFSEETNRWLIEYRGVSFEEAIAAMAGNGLLDIIPHPNLRQYPNQEIYILYMNSYVYAMPLDRKSVV